MITSSCFTQEDVTLMEFCENMLELEADANLRSHQRMFGCLV